MLRRAYDYRRNLRPGVPTARTTNASLTRPETRAMIRHGSPYMTVAPMAHWPMTRRMPIPELKRAQDTLIRKTTAASGLTPSEITPFRPIVALPARQRLPARTTPKPIYP